MKKGFSPFLTLRPASRQISPAPIHMAKRIIPIFTVLLISCIVTEISMQAPQTVHKSQESAHTSGWNVNILDDFQDNRYGWSESNNNQGCDNSTMVIYENTLRWIPSSSNPCLWVAIPFNIHEVSDFDLSVDLFIVSGSRFNHSDGGLVFRASSDGQRYIFIIRDTRHLTVCPIGTSLVE